MRFKKRNIFMILMIITLFVLGAVFLCKYANRPIMLKLKCFILGHRWEGSFSSRWEWEKNDNNPDERYKYGYKYKCMPNYVKCERCGSFLYDCPSVDFQIYPMTKDETFSDQGKTIQVKYWSENVSPFNGKNIFNFQNGKVSAILSYKKGKLEGECTEYYADGTVRGKWMASVDKIDGPARFYYPSGALRWEGTYEKGRLIGKTKEFYENGKLKREDEFVNGIDTGISSLYYPSGNLKWTREYKNGLRDGLSIEYFEDGKLFRKGTFSKGKGKYTVYDRNGKVTKFGYYDNGKVVYKNNT